MKKEGHNAVPVASPSTHRASSYHDVRFFYDPRRAPVWRAVARYLQRWVCEDAPLLDLGAGYGEFTRAVRARERWAMEQDPALQEYWDSEVRPLFQSVLAPWPLRDSYLGTVFASNFFEHFTIAEGEAILAEARRALRPGGRLIAVQPNFRLEPRRYFDDYTHRTAFSHVSFPDLLRVQGWRIVHVEPRFMPFTMKSSRLPTAEWLVNLYLALPYRPLAGQFLVVAES